MVPALFPDWGRLTSLIPVEVPPAIEVGEVTWCGAFVSGLSGIIVSQ